MGALSPCYNTLYANTYTHYLLSPCLSLASFHLTKVPPRTNGLYFNSRLSNARKSSKRSRKHPFGELLQDMPPLPYFWRMQACPKTQEGAHLWAVAALAPSCKFTRRDSWRVVPAPRNPQGQQQHHVLGSDTWTPRAQTGYRCAPACPT